jgi:hypothetical protein
MSMATVGRRSSTIMGKEGGLGRTFFAIMGKEGAHHDPLSITRSIAHSIPNKMR